MIKLPKEVSEVIRQLNSKGFSCYAVGGCVRDAMLGIKPLDWDLASNAKYDQILEIFPEASVLSEKYSVVRIDFTKSEDDDVSPILDIATYRTEDDFETFGKPEKITFVDTIEEDLERRDYTINAMADNPQKGFVDPFDGKKDINEKILRIIGDPEERFEEDPIRILRGIRLAAEKGFDVELKTFDGMERKSYLLNDVSVDKIRDEFEKIMAATYAGKGIALLVDSGAINAIVGKRATNLKGKKRILFTKLIENIDKTYPVKQRRMGLFFSALGDSKIGEAIERLNFDKKTKTFLLDAVYNMDKLGAVQSEEELKDFMYQYGLDRYTYMDDLAQDKVVVYGGSARKINKRYDFVKKFELRNDPIFAEDLLIDGDDLKELGFEGEQIGEVIDGLVGEVHRKPHRNSRNMLIELAKGYKKNPLKLKISNNKWIKRLR